MKPYVCPKCDGEAMRMAGCAPCKGSGVVWEAQTLAPNPYVWPQPYIFIPTEPLPSTPYDPPPQITWTSPSSVTIGGNVAPSDISSFVYTYTGTLQ